MSLKLALVVNIHPGQQAVDLIMLGDGSRVPMVQVMSPFASSDSGLSYIPNPGKTSTKLWDITAATQRDVRAVVGMLGQTPMVLGFLFPQVSQTLFNQDRMMVRHDSGAYVTIAPGGDVELYRPGGSFIRIGDSAHESLTGKDADGRWADGSGSPAHVHLEVGGGVASFDMSPDGSVTMKHTGALVVTTGGDATVNVTGNTTVKSPTVTLDADVKVTKSLTVAGPAAMNGGMSAQPGSGGGAAMTLNGSASIKNGNLTVPDGEVTASGIGLVEHHHTAQGPTSPTTPSQA